jgi:LacI family transcriptional regulator
MSIVEVAKVAGVSHTTVSRFLNNSGKVNKQTAQRIQEAMAKIGYVPNPPHLRRGPVSHSSREFKTKNIAFLTVSDSIRILNTSPFLIELVHGIEQAVSDNGLSLFHGILSADRPLPAFLLRGGVDGLIVYPGLENVPKDYIEVLKRYPIVFVLSGKDTYFLGDRVMCNHEHIGKIAAEYLISRGHRRVVYFDLQASMAYHPELFRGRWARFEEVCGENGAEAQRIEIPLTSEETLSSDDEVRRILKDTLQKTFLNQDVSMRPTGIFVVFDSLTAALYPVFQSCGIRAACDVDIISCNNEIPLLAGLHPRPATIDLQPEMIGRKAFERIRYRVQNPHDETRVTVEVLPKLILEDGMEIH